ncbi:MAG: hypothetical protein H0W74_04940 [Sphingosinicella sp.]|nr:hypothetical protein [Sphingosinicella sp.]
MRYFSTLSAAVLALTWIGSSPAGATCPVPNPITAGQVADAPELMGNFDALSNCSVSTTGSPAPGNLAIFSGPKSVTSGNLTGDVTTSGGLVTTLSPTGVTPGNYANPVITVDGKGRITAASSGTTAGGAALKTAKIRRNAGQTTPSGAYTKILFDTSAFGDPAITDLPNSRLRVPAGYNRAHLTLDMGVTIGDSGSYVHMWINHVRGDVSTRVANGHSASDFYGGLNTSAIIDVAEGDYFEAGWRAGSGITISDGGDKTSLALTLWNE